MKDRLYKALIANGFYVNTAKIIVAQAAHETAVAGVPFQSAIFVQNNNPFGMKVALIRPTTNIGSNKGHAVFSDIESAVKDFAYWWRFSGMLPSYSSPEVYAGVLKQKNYYEADYTEYARGVRHFYNQLWA